MRVPAYIRAFMGNDFRPVEGVNVRFDMKKFYTHPNFDCGVENRAGCYIISTDGTQINYARGTSRVLYIGLSEHLYTRLYQDHYQKHLKLLLDNPDFGVESRRIVMMQNKYQYMYYLGARVDVFYCKGSQSSKEFESMLLANFYDTYRSIPIGNAARSFSQK